MRHGNPRNGADRIHRLEAAHANAGMARVASALYRRGLRRGDRIGLFLPTDPQTLVVIGGALRAGIIPVVANCQLTERELDTIVDDAQATFWVRSRVELRELVDEDSTGELAAYPLGRPMHYTSGTTGRPKGVWSGVLDEAAAAALWEEELAQWQFSSADVHLVCSPLQHSAPVRFALATLLAGGTVLVPEAFSVEVVARAVSEGGANTTFCTPAHLQRLEEMGCLELLSGMRFVAHAGAPCPPRLKRSAIDRVGASALWEFYGSTEGQFTVCSGREWLERPGTVGRARPGRRIFTDDDQTLWCAVPPYARWSYWRDAEKTDRGWRGDAFTVGDVGRIDDEGYVYLDGRRNDLIISGGVNVYPTEVENVLQELAGIVELAVFPRDDQRWGQRVCAVYVGNASVDDLRDHAVRHLAPFKRPKEYHRVEFIPRVGLSKVRRTQMAELLGLE